MTHLFQLTPRADGAFWAYCTCGQWVQFVKDRYDDIEGTMTLWRRHVREVA